MRSTLHTSIKLVLSLVLVSALSCIKRVEIKIPPFEKRLVIHGYIAVGDSFALTVGQTVKKAYDVSFPDTYVSNAIVQLFEQGVLKDTLRYDSATKYYISKKIKAEAGRSYTIQVEAAGFPPVDATATGMPISMTESLTYTREARSSQYGNSLDDIRFSFRDPAGVKNYYFLAVHPNAYDQGTIGCVYSTDPVIEKQQGELLPFDNGDCIDPETIFFTDKSFDGQLEEISLSGSTVSLRTQFKNGRFYRPYIKRYAISREFYDYYKYTSSQQGSDLPSTITEITNNRGNINNGYGIFTVFDVVTDTLR